MKNFVQTVLEFLMSFLDRSKLEKITPTPIPTPTPPSTTPAKPKEPQYPKLDPAEYKNKLQQEVGKKGNWPVGYTPQHDDPTTTRNERRTYCNFFVREVCKWFGWNDFRAQDRDQAGEITLYMRTHPDQWRKLEATVEYTDAYKKQKTKMGADYAQAAKLASQGHLVVAGQINNPQPTTNPGDWHPSGHVCIIAPESVDKMIYSGKWGRRSPIAANVGKSNWYGKPLAYAFGEEPEIFLYLGQGPTT